MTPSNRLLSYLTPALHVLGPLIQRGHFVHPMGSYKCYKSLFCVEEKYIQTNYARDYITFNLQTITLKNSLMLGSLWGEVTDLHWGCCILMMTLQFVYWSDTTENIIYRTSLDGSEREVFLNCSHGVGVVDGESYVKHSRINRTSVDSLNCKVLICTLPLDTWAVNVLPPLGLAVDWEARRLYFTNMGHSTPGLDGVVYSWHRIEVISLDGRNRKTVVTDVESPRGLDLDMRNGWVIETESVDFASLYIQFWVNDRLAD